MSVCAFSARISRNFLSKTRAANISEQARLNRRIFMDTCLYFGGLGGRPALRGQILEFRRVDPGRVRPLPKFDRPESEQADRSSRIRRPSSFDPDPNKLKITAGWTLCRRGGCPWHRLEQGTAYFFMVDPVKFFGLFVIDPVKFELSLASGRSPYDGGEEVCPRRGSPNPVRIACSQERIAAS